MTSIHDLTMLAKDTKVFAMVNPIMEQVCNMQQYFDKGNPEQVDAQATAVAMAWLNTERLMRAMWATHTFGHQYNADWNYKLRTLTERSEQ